MPSEAASSKQQPSASDDDELIAAYDAAAENTFVGTGRWILWLTIVVTLEMDVSIYFQAADRR